MIEEILPAEAVAVETRADRPATVSLPGEWDAVAAAIERRRLEFATARACAREALLLLDLAPVAIPVGARGEPRWPAGVVGSITHCDGYRACALGRAARFGAIGIDAEPDAPLPAGVLERISGAAERAWVAERLRREPEIRWDRLLFVLKEAAYKDWLALVEGPFDFTALGIALDPGRVALDRARSTFRADPPADARVRDGKPLPVLKGAWLARDGLLLGAVALARART